VEVSVLHPLEFKARTKLLAFTEGPLVVDDRPGFLFRDNCWNQGDHACACTTVLHHPEQLAIFPLLMELAVREIAGARIQNLTGLALAIPFLTMTIEASPLALEQRFSFCDALRGRSNRILIGIISAALIPRNLAKYPIRFPPLCLTTARELGIEPLAHEIHVKATKRGRI
jgi:hypothetical protein